MAKTSEPTKKGRPSNYDYNLCIEICNQVAEGKHIMSILDSDDRFPAWSNFRVWKRENAELQTLYTYSIQDKAEMVTFEINQVMADLKGGLIDAPSARVLIDTLKWYAAKFYPKMFGDKLDLTTDGDKINKSIVEISPELQQALIDKL